MKSIDAAVSPVRGFIILLFAISLFNGIRASLLGISSTKFYEENDNMMAMDSSCRRQPGETNNNSTIWRLVVTGNSAYLPDLLCWWELCQKTTFCYNRKQILRAGVVCSGPSGSPNVIFYAEDATIYHQLSESKNLIVKKAWEVSSKFADAGVGNTSSKALATRFAYDDHQQFFPMMSRRPSILLHELQTVSLLEKEHQEKYNKSIELGVLFCDLDVFLLQDPRPFFEGDYDMWGANARNGKTGPYNAGFLALRTKMIPVLEAWRDLIESRVKASPNQMSFNNLLKRLSPKYGLRHKLLPKENFLVGKYLQDLQKEHKEEAKRQGRTFEPLQFSPDSLKPTVVAATRRRERSIWACGSLHP